MSENSCINQISLALLKHGEPISGRSSIYQGEAGAAESICLTDSNLHF